MRIGNYSDNTNHSQKPLNLNLLKLKFFNYLEEKNEDNNINAADLMASDVSLFMFSGEFQKFIEEEGYNLGLDEDFSGSMSDLLELEFDSEKEELVAGEDATDEQKSLIDIVNDLFKNEDVKKSSDMDGDGKLSQEEMTNFLQLMNEFDEDKENLSLNDIFSAMEGLKDGTFNPSEGIVPPALGNPPDVQQPPAQASSTPTSPGGPSGSSSSNPVYGSNGVPATPLVTKSSPTETSDKQAKDIEEIDREIAQKNNEITTLSSEKANAYSNNNEYKSLIASFNDAGKAISDSNTNITKFEQELHQVQTDISSKQAEFDNLQDPKIFKEYKEEIESKRNELKSSLESLKTKASNLEDKISKEKQTLSKNEKEKSDLEKQISDFETNNPNEKIKDINSAIENLKKDIDSLKQQKEIKEQELKNTREQEKSDSKVYGKMTAYRQSEFVKYMMDYATSPATADAYNKAKHAGAWCAVFTSEVTEKLYAIAAKALGIATNRSQGLNGNQVAMHTSAWGNSVQSDINKAGIKKQATINIGAMSMEERRNAVRNGLIYPGMTFEYEANGGYHTGFIESINPDLTWNTIEGNTKGGVVGTNQRDATNNRLTSVTDTTLKVYYWLLAQKGYSADQINRMLYQA